MLYGRKAFPGGQPTETLLRAINAHAFDTPTDPTIPGELVILVEKAMAKEKSDRFSTAREFQLALEGVIENLKSSTDISLEKTLETLFSERTKARNTLPERTVISQTPILEPAPQEQQQQTPLENTKKNTISWPLRLGILSLLIVLAAFAAWHFVPSSVDVLVRSTPPGAEILLDGETTGFRTPAALKNQIPGSSLKITLNHPYYEPWEKSLAVEKGTPSVEATLTRSMQLCRIVTTPPRAKVWLNQQLLDGQTPLDLTPLPLGIKHSLKMELEGHAPFLTEFILEEKTEEKKVLSFVLPSMYKTLVLETTPTNAILVVDGKRLPGDSPFHLDKLLPNQPVRITCGLEGYRTFTREIQSSEFGSVVKIALQPYSADLILEAPPGTTLQSRGRSYGSRVNISKAHETPQVITVLPLGAEGRLVLRIQVHSKLNDIGLSRTEANLNLDAKPWARLRIDNREHLTTPISNLVIDAGRHKLSYTLGQNPNEYSFDLVLQ